MIFWVATAVLMAFALPVDAQQSEKAIEVSPFAGYLFGGRLYDFALDGAPGLPPTLFLRYDVADHVTYGLRIGYKTGSRLEPEIQWSHTETHLRNLGGSPTFCVADCLRLDYFLGGITYNFGRGSTRPYVSAAVGLVKLSPTFPADLSSSEAGSDLRFTGSLGIGVKTFFTPSLGLRFEARGYASRIAGIRFGPICTTFSDGGPGGPVVPVTAPCPTKAWLMNGELTGGLLFAF